VLGADLDALQSLTILVDENIPVVGIVQVESLATRRGRRRRRGRIPGRHRGRGRRRGERALCRQSGDGLKGGPGEKRSE
jgi:hypothetical protein